PAGLSADAIGNLYVADAGNRRVRRIFGQSINTVQDGAGKQIEFTAPTGVAVDAQGTLYVADGTPLVARIPLAGVISFLPAMATSIAVDRAGRVLVAGERQIRRIDPGGLTIVVGTGFGSFAGDGG